MNRRQFLASTTGGAMALAEGALAGGPTPANGPAPAQPNRRPGNDWPMANGPTGNFVPARANVPLLDDIAQTRLLWRSEDNDLGYGKGSVSGYLQILSGRPSHPGSFSGPIVAGGKVFCNSFRPRGEFWAENQVGVAAYLETLMGERRQRLLDNLRIDADDLLLACDQRTERTIWKAVEEGRGFNRYMGKRLGFARCSSMATSSRWGVRAGSPPTRLGDHSLLRNRGRDTPQSALVWALFPSSHSDAAAKTRSRYCSGPRKRTAVKP